VAEGFGVEVGQRGGVGVAEVLHFGLGVGVGFSVGRQFSVIEDESLHDA